MSKEKSRPETYMTPDYRGGKIHSEPPSTYLQISTAKNVNNGKRI